MTNYSHSFFKKCIYFLLILLCTSTSLIGQNGIVSGVVLDSHTGDPLPFANVFLNNTTLGKATDMNGKFRLEALPEGATEIVASFVGYLPQYKSVLIRNNKEIVLELKLRPLEKELEGVELSSRRDRRWERQLTRFSRVFLGEDHIASETKILNPWILDFEDGRDEGGLPYFAAKADKPLEIENHALGYKINYFLKDFKQTRRGFNFKGLVQYTEMSTMDQAEADKWHTNRQRMYLGSTRHLFKAMINNDLEEQGYRIYQETVDLRHQVRTNSFRQELGNTVEPFPTADMSAPGNRVGEYKLKASRKLEIHYIAGRTANNWYIDVYHPLSWIVFKGGSIDVTAKGVDLNPYDFTVSGHMSKVRVSHMLPHNFSPDESINTYEPSAFIAASARAKWLNYLEKPYLHTDKPYYYPGETIWLKGYMMYENPLMADTLSRVLYVDLISAQKQVVQSHSFPIENGQTKGQVILPPTLEPGDYTVRAYTHWMRNFDSQDFFFKAIPVLNITHKALADQVPDSLESITSADYSPIQLSITPAKAQHGPREQMTFTVEITDEDGYPLVSNMSVAVVDTAQVAYIAEEKDIVEAYEWVQVPKNIEVGNTPAYPIEYGIALEGVFRNRKEEPEAVNLMMVQGKYENYGTVQTDSLGRFWASGLHFTDSAEISFGAVDKKGRPYGKTVLDKRLPPPLPERLPTLVLNTREKEVLQRFFIEGKEGYTLLDEVTVKEDKLERLEDRNYGYGAPDYSVSGERLKKVYGTVLQALQGTHGVRVLREQGVVRVLVGRSPGAFDSFGAPIPDPLLIIDGQRIFTENVAEYLEYIDAAELKSVDIYTYGAAIFGMAGYGGVILLETKKGERIKDDPAKKFYNKDGLSLYTVKGYTAAAKFTAPDYSETRESHDHPDYRSTLYWNPAVSTDAENGKATFSFYAADLTTTYKVVVEGVTEDNTPFRQEQYVSIIR